MVPLRVRIVGMGACDTKNLFHDGAVGEGARAKPGPVLPLTSINHVVDSGKCVFPTIQMTVQHRSTLFRNARSEVFTENIA